MSENISQSSAENQYHKASMAVEKKNYGYAIDLLTHAVNTKPDFEKARQLLRIAQVRNFDENPPNSLQNIINKVCSFMWGLTASLSEFRGETSISIYEKILKKDPKNVAILVRLGNALKAEGLKESAVVTLEMALKISPKETVALISLGYIYSETGNYKRARFCFNKVLELKPYEPDAERGLKNLDALTTIDRL